MILASTRQGGNTAYLCALPPCSYHDGFKAAVSRRQTFITCLLAALPSSQEKSERNIVLVRDYVQQHFVSAGMCADVCIHNADGTNPHAHVMLTMRPFNEDGT